MYAVRLLFSPLTCDTAPVLPGARPAVTGAMDAWLPALTSLEYLDVAMNQLTSTIPPLSSLAGLRTFSVALNQLTGTLPSDFLALLNIREFDASSNRRAAVGGCPRQAPCTSVLVPACSKSGLVTGCRLRGTVPGVGIPVPGLDPQQYSYLGLGGDLYSDLCMPLPHPGCPGPPGQPLLAAPAPLTIVRCC